MQPTLKLLLIVFVFFETYLAQAQDTTTALAWKKHDHAENRLFWMSTGRISTPQKFFLGNFEIITTQIGYTPTNFLQLNASYALTFEGSYWSIGAKAQIFKSDSSFLRGLAIGTDLGFFPEFRRNSKDILKDRLQAFNIAASFGSQNEQVHINFMGLTDRGRFETLLQVGGSVELNRLKSSRGLKLMAEGLFSPTNSTTFGFFNAIVGVRSYGEVFVGDFGLMYFPRLNLGSDGPGSKNLFFPYFSVMWYF